MPCLAFRSGPLRAERPVDDAAAAYIDVEADFAIEVDGEAVYSEVMFPVVELAAALRRWLVNADGSQRSNFEWDSMSTEERGWVWIRGEQAGWRVGSIHQERAVVDVWSFDQVAHAVEAFCAQVIERGHTDLKVDLTHWID